MKRRLLTALALTLLAAGCSGATYDIEFKPAGGTVRPRAKQLLTIEVKPRDPPQKAGKIGESLCLLAMVSQGSLSCVANQCISQDTGRTVALPVPTVAPRLAYLQYNAPEDGGTEIIGVSLYQTYDCADLDRLEPLIGRAFVFEIEQVCERARGDMEADMGTADCDEDGGTR